MDKKYSLWTKDFIITTLANFFLFFSFQMLIPTLPAYTEFVGGDAFIVGWVIGIFTISALLTRPFVGKALDTLNRRNILLIGLSIIVLSVISYNWANTVISILIVRFIHGIGWGITTTSLGTIISEIIPSNRRGEGMGYYGLSTTLAMALAPLLGIRIMNSMGFTYLFVLSFVLAIVSLFLSQFIKYPNVIPKKNTEKKFKLNDLYESKALFPSFLILIFTITYGGIVTFITLFGKEVGIENVGWFFFGNAITVMITRPIAGRIFDRKGHRWVLIPGAIFAAIGLIILSFSTNIYYLLLASFFYGMGFGTVQPALQAWTINRVPPQRKGAANGTFYSAFDLGIGTGSIVLGIVANVTTYATMYKLSIIILLIFIVFYLFYFFRYHRLNKAK